MSDMQSRKWQITINNPLQKGFTHEKISTELQALKSIVYCCMSDEIGQTYHTHVYAAFSSAVRFSTLKARFPEAHLEATRGTSAQNRDYIRKSGKWENDVKHGTRIPGTFEEWGEIPEEQPGRRTDLADLYEMIKSGATDVELLESFPKSMLYLDKIERVRQALKAERYSTEFRPLEVTYIWGPTGSGKTRGVMEQYGYDRVCRVTDYDHPFERYAGEDVLLFDEFRSQLRISDMLNYLDGYPLMLPCRYANRQACYTKVFLISNVPLDKQYKNVQYDEPVTWEAFRRRIHYIEYLGVSANEDFTELADDDGQCPF
ncbi:MAG: replication protein [Eubacteriales bacterium]|nr:replication protein [Eubacteriales bacterium]